MKSKLTTSRIWMAVTLLTFAAVYIIFSKLGIGMLGKFAFYLTYLALSIVIFYKTLLGEYAYYLHAAGNEDAAVKLSKKAYEKGTKSLKCLNYYGVLLMQDGKGNEALEVFYKALKMNKSNYMRKFLLMNIAGSHWVNNDIDTAIEAHKDILNEYSYANEDFYTTLGFLYILKNDFDNAQIYTNKALEESPSHAPAFDNMGQIYFRQGDMAKAEENFLLALEIRPDMADSNYYLALVHENKGDLDSAKEYLEKALNCDYTALTTVKKETVEQKINMLKDITQQ